MHKGKISVIIMLLATVFALPCVHALTINLVADAGLSSNQAALDAFRRAAAQWESVLFDPIVVTLNVGLANLGNSSIIGQAGSVSLTSSYANFANAMYGDSLNEPTNSIVGYLPTSAPTFILPTGFSYNGGLTATKANLKALGFTGLDTQFGVADGTITFNSQFSFDYDNRDGVSGMDFESVAAHEIGHALGFVSIVDQVDYYVNQGTPTSVSAYLLDLFRFNAANNPSSTSQFTTLARELRPGQSAVYDDVNYEYGLSTGLYTGDGRQSSHWLDNGITGNWIGIMDPTLAYNVSLNLTSADVRVLDLLGYETTPIPEPTSLCLFALGIASLYFARRKKA